MKCVIIEDEQNALEHLEYQLAKTSENIEVIARLDSIEESVPWLKDNEADLIFLDIQLGDGLSFEIFDHIQIHTPVIFTTSFEQYTLRAFELNSIAYLLKPVKLEDLKLALEKMEALRSRYKDINQQLIPLQSEYQKRFLVREGKAYKSIEASQVAYFYLQNARFLFLVTHDKQQYLYDTRLEILEQRLDPVRFFRVNRHFIVSFQAIKNVIQEERRFLIQTIPEHKEPILISIPKAASFRIWLDQ